jgi:serine phosphatase RsbU (regulator of sigma subunit)
MTDLLERLRALGSGRLLQDVLALVLDAALEMTHAERGFIMLAGADGRLEFRMGRGPAGQTLTDATFVTSRQVPSQVFLTGRTEVHQDLFQDDTGNRNHFQTSEFGIRHIVCVALKGVRIVDALESKDEDRRIGVLYLDGKGRGSFIAANTRSALETLAAEASMAIEHARMYREVLEKARLDQELRVAAEIQQALLPPALARRPYLDAAAVSKPCRAIGGDFFDYLGRDEAAFGFTLGDVAGKGPPAALMSAMMQGMFSFAAHGVASEQPAAIVTAMNHALCERALEAKFVTLLLGVISREGHLTYCNAGHCPPLIVGISGVRRLENGGPVVGLLPNAAYEHGEASLEPGDVVVVFSDGVTEARDAADEEFGDARLIEVIHKAAAVDTQSLVDAVVDAVRQHSEGVVQTDDITVMAIRYRGAPA